MSRGAIMLYNGQEVGEPAAGAEGFGGDDARTTIFDYWSMPELVKWVNGHRYDGGGLSEQQKYLRAFYARLLGLAGEPAFRDGAFFGLNATNVSNEHFGRLPGETASGHWLYAFLRCDHASGQRFLIAANLHSSTMLRDLRVRLPPEALSFLQLDRDRPPLLAERLCSQVVIRAEAKSDPAGGLLVHLTKLPPLT